MLKRTLSIMAALLLIVLATGLWSPNGGEALASRPFDPPPPVQVSGGNLLTNGNMDQYEFYWRPTNHYIAGMWYEWFWTEAIPEYIDGGITEHNVCYPPPPPGKLCVVDMGNHSQGYIRWGAPYLAGIYQPVSVTPCINYRFDIYNSNQDANYRAKVGIDPTGQGLPPYVPPDGDGLPLNCPPDGISKCPNPGIESLAELPSHMVWSPENNNADWTLQSVTAEAVSTTITVWTYAAPDESAGASLSTYWDEASLTEAPFPGNRLPAPVSWTPSGFIQNLSTALLLDKMIVTWDTPSPASSQVWYNVTPTTTVQSQSYTFATPLDTAPVTHHRAVITGLQSGDTVDLVALSRRPTGDQCATEVSAPQSASALLPTDRVPPPDSWIPSGAIQNLTTIVALDDLTISWDTSAFTSTTQVWYDVSPASTPITPTGPLSYTIYMPVVTATRVDDHQYAFATSLDLALATHHQTVIRDLHDGDIVLFVALSSRVVNDTIVTQVSDSVWITMDITSTTATGD